MRRELDVGSLGAADDDIELGSATPREPEAALALGDAHRDLVPSAALERLDARLGGGLARDASSLRRRVDVDVDARLVPGLAPSRSRRGHVESKTDASGCLEARHRSAALEPGGDGGATVDALVAATAGAPSLDRVGVDGTEECVREHDAPLSAV